MFVAQTFGEEIKFQGHTNTTMCKKHFHQCKSYETAICCVVCNKHGDDTPSWVPVKSMANEISRVFETHKIDFGKEELSYHDWLCEGCSNKYTHLSNAKHTCTLTDDLQSENKEIKTFAKAVHEGLQCIKNDGHVFMSSIIQNYKDVAEEEGLICSQNVLKKLRIYIHIHLL